MQAGAFLTSNKILKDRHKHRKQQQPVIPIPEYDWFPHDKIKCLPVLDAINVKGGYLLPSLTGAQKGDNICAELAGNMIRREFGGTNDYFGLLPPPEFVLPETYITLDYVGIFNNPYKIVPNYCSFFMSDSFFISSKCEMPIECGYITSRLVVSSWLKGATHLCQGVGAFAFPKEVQDANIKALNLVFIYQWKESWWDQFYPFIRDEFMIMYDGDDYWAAPSALLSVMWKWDNDQFIFNGNFTTGIPCYHRYDKELLDTIFRRYYIGPDVVMQHVFNGQYYNFSALHAALPLPFTRTSTSDPMPYTFNIQPWRSRNYELGVGVLKNLIHRHEKYTLATCIEPRRTVMSQWGFMSGFLHYILFGLQSFLRLVLTAVLQVIDQILEFVMAEKFITPILLYMSIYSSTRDMYLSLFLCFCGMLIPYLLL